jgi:hypothetical protein
MNSTAFDQAFERVRQLAETFKANEKQYLSADYQEAEARKDFIDKFWIALGWDVNHDTQTNPYAQEVKVERAHGHTQRRADYAFYLAPNFHEVRFFVEAKKPFRDIARADNYFQTLTYGYSAGTPLAVLMDFEEFHVLDCRYEPSLKTALQHGVTKWHYSDYCDRETFAHIYWRFSREAVAGGWLEKWVEDLPSPHGKAGKGRTLRGAYKPADEGILAKLDGYRAELAKALKAGNPQLDSDTLTAITQRILDRLVFLRFLEDKQIEPQPLVDTFGGKAGAWRDFLKTSRHLDRIYNGVVFKKHAILDDPTFRVDENTFTSICQQFSHVNSPYNFAAIPIHILGSIYERFLGKVIVATDKRVRVEEKPEVRKAGGVYYTPEYIVRYIVENTVGRLIAGKTPDQIAGMRFADIACGSGSFLLGVYDLLLQYHGNWYNANPRKAHTGDCVQHDGRLYLSLAKKRDILVNNIYGVDISSQAVEVCQLSLYLKLLEEETLASTKQYLLDFAQEALLPPLNRNIVCGNSLIGRDIVEGQLFDNGEARELNSMNFEDAFPEVMKRGGFDAIVGNPPYRMMQPHNTAAPILAYLRGHYVAAEFKVDLFHLFLQRAAVLLRDGGYLSYITPATILNNVYAEALRGWLMDHCCVEQIAVARGRVFADADVHTAILVFRRESSPDRRENNTVRATAELSAEFVKAPALAPLAHQGVFAKLPGRVWNILVNSRNAAFISRLSTEFTPLEKVAAINRGLITGNRAKYFAARKTSAQHVPIITGGDVHRYHTAQPSEFVLFRRPRTSGGCWDREVHFAPHKLVVRQICEAPTASILRTPLAVTGNIFTVRADSVETELYLLGIINSRLVRFFWQIAFADFKASFPQVTIFSLGQVPICLPNHSQAADKSRYDEIVLRVQQMLDATRKLAAAKLDQDVNYYEMICAGLDRQIDRLVYDLYGLTEEEIALVEKATAGKEAP